MTRGIFVPFARRKKPAKKALDSSNPSVKGYNTQANCLTCYDLDFQYIPQPHKDPRICSIGQPARHWISSAMLSENVGCKSCQFLKSAFDTLTDSWGISVAEGRAIPYQIAILIDQDDAGAEDADEQESNRTIREAPRKLKVVMRCNPEHTKGGKKGGFDEEFEIEIYTPINGPPSHWKAIGAAGEVPTNPSGEECANIARPWIEECDRNHEHCHGQDSSNGEGDILPRRVLDLSAGQIRLIETTPGQRGRYVALSHCWGKEQLLITTRETLADRMAGINIETMPRTFQDSIIITRGLGIPFIWIDSLCIIQKDAEDWEEQSAVMADIYARCYLNIAATRAAGGHEGILKPRYTRRDSVRWSVDFARQTHHGASIEHVPTIRDFEVQSYKIPAVDEDIRIRVALWSSHEALQTSRWLRLHDDVAPLLPRTWVYQERSLAPRSLHIHSSEMIWICNAVQRCECAALDATPLGGDGWSATKAQIAMLGEAKSQKALHGLWRTIVEDISILDLSFESDRLPALSGLATRFAEHFPQNERYLAGLWEGDLLRDLLWESGGSQQVDGPTRERKAGVPSWSWASLSWGGDHASGLDWEYETKPKLAEWAGTTTYKQDPRTRLISASVEVQGKNRYGTVIGGSVIVEGALCGIINGDKYLEQKPLPIPGVMILHAGSFNSLHLNYDTAVSAQDSSDRIVYCLLIGCFNEVFDDPNKPHVQRCGLMLRPTSEGRFERVGRWKQYVEDWTRRKEVWTQKASVLRVEII